MKQSLALYLVVVTAIAIGSTVGMISFKQQNLALQQELAKGQTYQKLLQAEASIHKGVVSQGVSKAGDQVVITYGDYQGYPLQLTVDNHRVILKIVSPSDDYAMGPGALAPTDFLKKEVERLVSQTNGVVLGDSGATFKFTGGVPGWGPYQSLGQNIQENCLQFADTATFSNGCLEVEGRTQKDTYWPYVLALK